MMFVQWHLGGWLMESFHSFDRVWPCCDFDIEDLIFLRRGIDKKLCELTEVRNKIDIISTTLAIYSRRICSFQVPFTFLVWTGSNKNENPNAVAHIRRKEEISQKAEQWKTTNFLRPWEPSYCTPLLFKSSPSCLPIEYLPLLLAINICYFLKIFFTVKNWL